MGMILHEFDQEKYERTVRSEGYEEGARDRAISAARNLLQMKVLSAEQIAKAQGLPLEEVLALQKEMA